MDEQKNIQSSDSETRTLASGNEWYCIRCGTKNTGKFCFSCGTEKPTVTIDKEPEQKPIEPVAEVIPEAPKREEVSPAKPAAVVPEPEKPKEPEEIKEAAPAEESAESKPESEEVKAEEPIPDQPKPRSEEMKEEPAAEEPGPAESDIWYCTKCGARNTGKFCSSCASPKPILPKEKAPSVLKKQKADKKSLSASIKELPKAVKIIAILFLVWAVMSVILSIVTRQNSKYTVNEAGEEEYELGVPEGYATFDYSFWKVNDAEVSFLYPEAAYVSYAPDDNLYVFASEDMGFPYITIYPAETEAVSPKVYFDQYNKKLKSKYPDAKMSSVKEVEVEDKILYMTSATVEDDEGTLTIERYLEQYPDMNIQYTLKTYSPEKDEALLSTVIGSLKLYEYAYEYPDYMKDIMGSDSADSGADTDDTAKQSDETETLTNDSRGITMAMPTSVNGDSITVGLYGASDTYTFLAAYMNTDSDGAMIYNKDDFMIRCTEDAYLLAQQIGVDQAAASNASAVTLNGQDAYQLDLEEITGNYHGKGKIYILSSENIGIYIVYYSINVDAEDQTALQSVADKCIATFDNSAGVQGIRTFEQMTYEKLNAVFVLEEGALKHGTQDTGSGLALYVGSDDMDAPITVEGKSAETVGTSDPSEYIQSIFANFQNSKYYTPSMTEITSCNLGRYDAVTADITYNFEGTDYTHRMVAFRDTNGLMWMVEYTIATSKLEDYAEITDDIIWSFALY